MRGRDGHIILYIAEVNHCRDTGFITQLGFIGKCKVYLSHFISLQRLSKKQGKMSPVEKYLAYLTNFKNKHNIKINLVKY